MVRTPRNVAAPPALVTHAKRWTARFQEIRRVAASREWATRGAKRVLAGALHSLAHGKCVFCESALDVSGDLEIDHYVAKVIAPHLAFEWTNLLPACRLCNRAKGEQDHANLLLKPDVEDPEPYFWMHPDTGQLQPHSRLGPAEQRRALETTRLCDLQLPALCTQRLNTMNRISRWLQLVAEAEDPSQALIEEWEFLSHPATEYKLVIRHMLTLHGLGQLANYDRTLFEAW